MCDQELFENKKFKQESFHARFTEVLHKGKSDWQLRLIDQAVGVDDLRQRESYWQHKLDIFQPDGLNMREVALFFNSTLSLFIYSYIYSLYLYIYSYSYCSWISPQQLYQ